MGERKKIHRILSLDLIRLLATLSIIYYHMIRALDGYGIRQLEQTQIFYKTKNLNLATVAVGLFFMVSGAGLMFQSKDQEHFRVKEFYKRRFFRVLVPFYLVYTCYFLFLTLIKGISVNTIWGVKNSPLTFLFTLFGMDGYFAQYGFHTWYLLGEWFLGALIIMYAVFPLLCYCMRKNKWITIGISTICYLVIIFMYQSIPIVNRIPSYTNVIVKIYEFIFGMFLVLVIEKIPKPVCLICPLPIIIYYFLCTKWLAGNGDLRIFIQNISFFFFFMGFESILQHFGKISHLISKISGFTYEAFLVHHIVINEVTGKAMGTCENNKDLILLFGKEILLIIVFALITWGITHLKQIRIRLKNISKK